MKKLRMAGIAALILCALLQAGCLWRRTPEPPAAPAPLESQMFSPANLSEEGLPDTDTYMLYFRFQDEEYLAAEARTVEVGLDERREERLVYELILGPSPEQQELGGLFSSEVRVLNVEEHDRMLVVTLSKEWLDIPAGVPQSWQSDPALVQEVFMRRQLSLASIVATITELGRYDQVQFLLDMDNEGGLEQSRMTRGLLYPGDSEKAGLALEPMFREDSRLLTARNAVAVALDSIRTYGWERLYKLTAAMEPGGVERPSMDAFLTMVNESGAQLADYSVGDVSVSLDGSGAVISISGRIAYKERPEKVFSNQMVRLLRENGLWKITYSSLSSLINP